MRFLRRFGPSVAAVAVTIAAIAGLIWRPHTVSSAHRASYVIIAGAPGLRWDDVNPGEHADAVGAGPQGRDRRAVGPLRARSDLPDATAGSRSARATTPGG